MNKKVIFGVFILCILLIFSIVFYLVEKDSSYSDYLMSDKADKLGEGLYTYVEDKTDELDIVIKFCEDNGIMGTVVKCNVNESDEPDQVVIAAGYEEYYSVYYQGLSTIIVVDDLKPIVLSPE